MKELYVFILPKQSLPGHFPANRSCGFGLKSASIIITEVRATCFTNGAVYFQRTPRRSSFAKSTARSANRCCRTPLFVIYIGEIERQESRARPSNLNDHGQEPPRFAKLFAAAGIEAYAPYIALR